MMLGKIIFLESPINDFPNDLLNQLNKILYSLRDLTNCLINTKEKRKNITLVLTYFYRYIYTLFVDLTNGKQ